MNEILTDSDIQHLIAEEKALPENFTEQIRLRPKRGHKEAELTVSGSEGSTFRLIPRQSNFNPFDFSVIIGYEIPKTNVLFRLRRYNGQSHSHTNKLEGMRFYGYHIHLATERYQMSGLDADAYAEPTDRYVDLQAALECAIADCGFHLPPGSQIALPFGGENS